MSDCRQQTFIDAPIEVVWELIEDVERHPDWWPRSVEVECDGIEPGCTYRQVTRTPFGNEDMELLIESLDRCEAFRIRCVNTGTYFRLALVEAQGGTFVEGQAGMDPVGIGNRLFDAVAGRRYFDDWLRKSLQSMREAAEQRSRSVAS